MPAWRASEGDDVGRQERVAATDDACGLALQREMQITRGAMRPVEHPALAVDAQPDVVLAAGGGLRDRERSARATLEFDQGGDVVDDLAPGNERGNVGRCSGDVLADRRACQLLCVTADGAHDERQAAPLGIEYPLEALVLGAVLHARGHAGLYVLDLYQP